MLNETVHNYAAVAPGTLHCFQCFSLALVPHGPTNFPKPSRAVPSRPKSSQSVPRFQERCVVEHAASPSCLATLQADPETWAHKTNRGNMRKHVDKNMWQTWKNQTSCKKREELWRTIWMSIGSDSTQYVAPSPRCDPSMSQPRWVCTPKCQIENHHDMELTDSADSGDGYRCCAWNIVK